MFDFVKWGAPRGKPSLGKKADSRLAEEGLSFSDFLGADQRPRRGRSAGPDFSPMRNRGKNRQRRGLPPPCGIHPAVLGVPASFSFQPLARWGHIDSVEILWVVLTSLYNSTSILRALPWPATVPSCRGPGAKAPEHCRISCVVGCRGGACPSRIPQGNTREPTGRASHGPYRSATGWCSKTPGGGNAASPR